METMCWKNSPRAGPGVSLERSAFNNQAQLKQNHRKQTAYTRNLGKGPILGKGEKRAQRII